jgi:uncharacterized membrane protein
MSLFHPNLFLVFEILGFVSYGIIVARELVQKNWLRLWEIGACTLFGLILEIGNTYLAHSYFYSPNFLARVFNVPLVIGFGWAVIIYCAMLLSDQYKIKWYWRPFLDAVTVLSLDLALDAIAIRLGFWNWLIPLNAEWYGVPFENLIGWILVALSFSFLIRFIRTLNPQRILTKVLMLASPILSYLALSIGLAVFSLVALLPYAINNWSLWLKFNYQPDISILYNPQVVLWKLIILVVVVVQLANIAVWIMVKYRRQYLQAWDLMAFAILAVMHLFFLLALWLSGLAKEEPVLVALSLAMLIAHGLLHGLPHLIDSRAIYWWRQTQKSLARGQKKIQGIVDASLR